jgi:Spy/CpxP family protein refolding chaperone
MGREFGPNRRDSIAGRQFGPGRMMLESIPNVTEKQKKEISDLMTKQREEMTKFRDEMQTKMKEMRESHRKSILSILTDEQKKFIEPAAPKTPAAPAVTK